MRNQMGFFTVGFLGGLSLYAWKICVAIELTRNRKHEMIQFSAYNIGSLQAFGSAVN